MALTDFVASRIRTFVPVLVGTLIGVIVKRFPFLGDSLDEAEVSTWLIPVSIGIYYDVVRRFEKRWPAVGWLLGLAKQPEYPSKPAPAA